MRTTISLEDALKTIRQISDRMDKQMIPKDHDDTPDAILVVDKTHEPVPEPKDTGGVEWEENSDSDEVSDAPPLRVNNQADSMDPEEEVDPAVLEFEAHEAEPDANEGTVGAEAVDEGVVA